MVKKLDHHLNGNSPQVPFHEIQISQNVPSNEHESTTHRLIQKVPELLLNEEKNHQDYIPKVVSIGPYHHGKPAFRLAESLKSKALEMVVSSCKEKEDLYYRKIEREIITIRKCYEEHATDMYSDCELARMMLLDACFIVIHMEMSVPPVRGSDPVLKLDENYAYMIEKLGMLTISIMLRDMFLVENQIPFWIVKLMIHSRYSKDESQELVNRYLNISLFGELQERRSLRSEHEEEVLHLLEAFHRLIIVNPVPNRRTIHQSDTRRETEKYYIHSFRSVTDLKAKGIHLKASPSQSWNWKDVKFKSNLIYGELQLPTWFVSIYAKVFFLNMIAYELSPSNPSNSEVTSCVSFMKSLIESPEDVKELREKKIIFNTLGSDEQVLNVYKDINTYEADNPLIFQDVKDKIQAHCNSKAKTWMAELIHTYFRSPWTAMALLAATCLLCLTALQTYYGTVQTYYAALQTHYAMHPKPDH